MGKGGWEGWTREGEGGGDVGALLGRGRGVCVVTLYRRGDDGTPLDATVREGTRLCTLDHPSSCCCSCCAGAPRLQRRAWLRRMAQPAAATRRGACGRAYCIMLPPPKLKPPAGGAAWPNVYALAPASTPGASSSSSDPKYVSKILMALL